MKFTRRQFTKTAALSAGALCLPAVARPSVRGANETIRVGVIGLGIRGGGSHVPGFNGLDGVQVTAVCDADMSRTDAVAHSMQQKWGNEVKKYQDLRQLIDDADVDAVSIATLQHWHALATVWACLADKDVYVEKPASHHMHEGLVMQRAADKTGRLVQVGTQRRSQTSVHRLLHWLRDEPLGPLRYVVSGASKLRGSIGLRTSPLPIPDHVDYDLWCGPARKVDLYRNRLQYDGNFDFNTGDGDSCNQSTHEIDLARWALGETTLPRRVLSIGTRHGFENDAADVARAQLSYYDFAAAPVFHWTSNLREKKGGGSARYDGFATTSVLHFEQGMCDLSRGAAYDLDRKEIPVSVPDDVTARFGTGDHFQNFIEAVRAGDRSHLNADIVEGALSTNVTHTANISFRTGQGMPPAAIRERIADLPAKFRAMFDWLETHCAANDVDISTDQLVCGPMLAIDPTSQTFSGHEAANELAKGFVRKGWEFPALS